MTSADAVRTLNTQILAGEGPDVLVLDGMPVDDYADQGVLADISTILNEVKETDGLLENIAYAKKQENGVYAAPVQFAMVAAAGEAETVSQLGSALGERSGSGSIEKLRELSQEAGLLSWSTVSYLAKNLYPLYSVEVVQEDGTLDRGSDPSVCLAVRGRLPEYGCQC